MILFNKSGVASKLGLDFLACVIDEGYSGEVHLNVVNTGFTPITLKTGMKLGQGILLPVNYAVPVEVPFDELYPEKSERGSGGFGSTGN